MALLRVKARWSGFNGAPGYSVFHFNDFGPDATYEAQGAANAVRTFFFALNGVLPTNCSIQVDSAVDEIDEATGKLVNIRSVSAPAVVTGMNTGSYAAPAGAMIHWLTGGVRNGRQVRGKTFLVPLAAVVFQSDGSLNSGHLGTLQTAAQALIDDASSALMVYARPSDTLGAGNAYAVTGARVPDKAVILRSRRD